MLRGERHAHRRPSMVRGIMLALQLCWGPDEQGGSHRDLRLGHIIQGYEVVVTGLSS